MNEEIQKQGQSIFEQIKKIDDKGNEFWSARDLSKVLDYSDFRNFISVVNKAKEACKQSGHAVLDHFVDFNEMAKHNTHLAAAAKDAGVIEPLDYAIFQNHGYIGLYGGLDAKAIHKKKGLKKNQQILDHMGSTELAANLFRATQTEEKLRRENIKGKQKANLTHFEVGKKVRKTIQELGGTMPENLPTEDSIKKLERKAASEEKNIEISTKKLPKK